MASFRGLAGSAAYCASKAVGRIYGEALRAELAPLGIKINVICPGFVKTPMTDVNPFTMPFLMSAERAAQIIKNGLEKNRARIAFPWPMVAMVALLAAVPQDWVNTMMKGRMRKPAFDADG
jgi:short-subunit dehydrogenase